MMNSKWENWFYIETDFRPNAPVAEVVYNRNAYHAFQTASMQWLVL